MIFPESQRVVYDKNPLELVICQLRFPTILRIDTEIPAAYQESIRNEYPLFIEPKEQEFGLGIPPEIAKLIGAKMPIEMGKSLNFLSADEVWRVTLTRDFIALSTQKYKKWEEFKERLRAPLDALVSNYRPAFFTRIGLRYRDVIRRSELRLDGVNWNELLNTTILGELSDPNLSEAIESSSRDLVYHLDGQGKIRVKHGLAPSKSTKEICYLIDCDFYSEERINTANAIGILDFFNQQSGRFFRWCIQDRLHEAMGPRPLIS